MNKEILKKCIKCNKIKPLGYFNFRKDTQKYRNCCKECQRKQHKEWYLKNKKTNIYHVKMKDSNITINDKIVKIKNTNITIKRDDDITYNCF